VNRGQFHRAREDGLLRDHIATLRSRRRCALSLLHCSIMRLDAAARRPPLPLRVASPRQQRTFAGYHGCNEEKISVLISALKDLLTSSKALPGPFFDLGSGDGRVVVNVCRSFPSWRAVGVELSVELVRKALTLAKQEMVDGSCEFRVGDLATADLSQAAVVFLYFPPVALPSLLTVLIESNLRYGATIVSADGCFKSHDKSSGSEHRHDRHANWNRTQQELLSLLQPSNLCWGRQDVYFYTWRGNREVRTADAGPRKATPYVAPALTARVGEVEARAEAAARMSARAASIRVAAQRDADRTAAEQRDRAAQLVLGRMDLCEARTASARAASLRQMSPPRRVHHHHHRRQQVTERPRLRQRRPYSHQGVPPAATAALFAASTRDRAISYPLSYGSMSILRTSRSPTWRRLLM
jgi:hypothetical protein